MLGRDVLSVFDVSVFGGLWNTLVPAVAVLAAFTLLLGAVAVRLLRYASGGDAQ